VTSAAGAPFSASAVMSRSVRTLSVAGVLCWCAGCGKESPPRVLTAGTVAGEYVMVERQGSPLPHTMRFSREGRTCELTLIRDVLTLGAGGEWREESEGRISCEGETPRVPEVFRTAGRYDLRGPRGDTLVLTDTVHPANERQQGVFRGDELRLKATGEEMAAPVLRFRYVRQRSAN
jgi:hypothetical protein